MFCIPVFKATAFYFFNQVYRAARLWCFLEINDSPESQTSLEVFFKLLTYPW